MSDAKENRATALHPRAALNAAWRNTPLAPLVASSAAFNAFLRSNNPGLRYVDHDAQGYASATVTAERFVVVFNKIGRMSEERRALPDPLPQRVRLTVFKDKTDVLVEPLTAPA
jgi:alkaline phosphatase D